MADPNREWYRRLERAEVLVFVTDRRREDLTLDFKVVAGNFDGRDERKLLAKTISGWKGGQRAAAVEGAAVADLDWAERRVEAAEADTQQLLAKAQAELKAAREKVR